VKAFDISAVDAADVKQLDALFTLAPNKGPVRFGASFCLFVYLHTGPVKRTGPFAMSTPADSSDEIRGRLSAVIARLEPLAHSTGSLDADDVRAGLMVAEHEVGLIIAALKRLPTPPWHGEGI
jgi:hypothetical protein